MPTKKRADRALFPAYMPMPRVTKPYQPANPKAQRAPATVPEIELPGNAQKYLEQRWRSWQAKEKGKGSASILEFLCWDFLVHKKGQREGVDFVYQWSIAGGRTVAGGFVSDFYFPTKHMVWNPAGLQFHYTKTKDRLRDRLSVVVLANRGIKEIFLWEDDLLQHTDAVLEAAWRGEQLGWRFKPT